MGRTQLEMIEDSVSKYGKTDLERLGIFIEMPYMIGKRYNFPKLQQIKGLNMLPGGPKIKCGNMDGYFDKTFMRLYEGERPPKRTPGKKPDRGPFIPIGPSKKHGTPGDYYGTFFETPCEYFSRALMKKPKDKKEKVAATFVTNPGKKGGPGYTDICLNKYPEHQTDRQKIKKTKIPLMGPPMLTMHHPQPYFDNNPYKDPDGKIMATYKRPDEKKIGYSQGPFIPFGYNKEDGYFEKFPEKTKDKYVSQYEANKSKRTKEIFVPPLQQPKTLRHFLTIDLKTKTGLNANTLETYEPTFIKYLL